MSFHVGVKKRTPNVTGISALSQRKAGTGCRPAPINQNPAKTIEWRMSSWEGGTQPTWSHGARYTSRHPPGLMALDTRLAWIWEVWGGLCALTGYALFVSVIPLSAINPWILAVAVLSLLHLLCWLRLRIAKARGSPVTFGVLFFTPTWKLMRQEALYQWE